MIANTTTIQVTETCQLRVWCIHTERAILDAVGRGRVADVAKILRRHGKVRRAFIKAAEAHRERHRYPFPGWLGEGCPREPERAWIWWLNRERERWG